MNKKLEVVTLSALQASLTKAQAHQQTCNAQVSAAKQTYYANKDAPNSTALREANLAFLGASGTVRKAREAIRIFTFQRKTLTPSGKLVRL